MNEGFPNYNKFNLSVSATSWGDNGSASIDGAKIAYTAQSNVSPNFHSLGVSVPRDVQLTESDISLSVVSFDGSSQSNAWLSYFSVLANATAFSVSIGWTPSVSGEAVVLMTIKGFIYEITFNYTQTA